jgi:hypothetical protein
MTRDGAGRVLGWGGAGPLVDGAQCFMRDARQETNETVAGKGRGVGRGGVFGYVFMQASTTGRAQLITP